jgi:hypothetical protein
VATTTTSDCIGRGGGCLANTATPAGRPRTYLRNLSIKNPLRGATLLHVDEDLTTNPPLFFQILKDLYLSLIIYYNFINKKKRE